MRADKRSRTRAVLALILSLFSLAAAAQLLRPMPAEAKRGQLSPPVGDEIVIGGKRFLLAPGAQIRDRENRIVMPFAVRDGALVRYLLDANGAVVRVWMLTPEEAARPDPK